MGNQTLHKPVELDDAEAMVNAVLSARLPYMFPAWRFAQYLKCIVRDKGLSGEPQVIQRFLQNWIQQYVASPREYIGEGLDEKRDQYVDQVRLNKQITLAEVTVEGCESEITAVSPTFDEVARKKYRATLRVGVVGLTEPIQLKISLPY
jgi:predicted component of type VI protein secretion system